MNSNKECKYPQREKKITLLESQLNKLKDRIIFLEKKLEEANNKQTHLNESNCNKKNVEVEITDNNSIDDNSNINTLQNLNGKNDEKNITFSLNHVNVLNNSYFGISSGQVFDSELKSHLFEITQDNDKTSLDSFSPIPQTRHFFKDPSLDSSFSGIVMLPDKDYALLLVDKVIKFLSHEYYLFDTNTFYKEIDEAYEKLKDKKPLWLCYLLMTLAVGEQYLNHSQNNEIPGMKFYIAAMRLYKSMYEEPTLEFVQTLILIAFYLQGLNSANAAFSFYGLAIRSALIQGLHRNIPLLPPIEKEKRKRLWWTIFIMDSIWCSNLGHPIHVQIDDIDVDFPEENFVDLNDGFNIELLGYSVKLAKILSSVMKDVYSPVKGSNCIKLTKVLNSVEELDKLQNIISSTMKNNLIVSDNRSTANLYLRLNQYIIVTTRPLLLSLFKGKVQPTDSIKHVVSRCVNAAILSIDILTNLKNNDWLSAFGFWDAQYCFSSIIILIICRFSGKEYPQINIGRKINTFMKDAGNFTAIDNEQKLIELDDLLSKIFLMYHPTDTNNGNERVDEDNSKLEMNNNNSSTIDSQNTSNTNKQNANLSNDSNEIKSIGQNIQTSDIYNDNEKTISEIEDPNGHVSENHNKIHNSKVPSPNNFHLQNILQNSNPILEQQGFHDFIEDMRSTYSDSVGDFTSFRNNISPDTWNELTTNLQYWDPANI